MNEDMRSALFEKWLVTIRVSLTRLMAYRSTFLLSIVAPGIVYYLIKYNLWASIFTLQGIESIQGFTQKEMLEYQAWGLIAFLLTQGFISPAIAEDIRLGRISAFLLYPFEFWQFHCAAFTATQAVQLLIALVTIFFFIITGLLSLPSFIPLVQGLSLALLVGLLWFTIVFMIGITSFWLEETWTVRIIFFFIAQLFSGSYFPLEFFPRWLQAILMYTPFPYFTYVPCQLLMGTYQGSFLQACGITLLWGVFTILCARRVWSRGMRLYTAAGM